ncbi:MAG: nuclear transport factor 2 family protein [Solirubrobacteraceae bacterium]|jgi:ketosteroid isomerase-like protein
MASTNVEIVRSILEEWERGDFSSAEWAHSEIEYLSADPVLPLERAGLADMAKVWRNWLRAWEDFHVDGDEYREVNGERVLVLVRYSGRGNPGGLQVGPVEAACLFHVRDGKVVKLVLYWDRERALAALGLARDTDSSDS